MTIHRIVRAGHPALARVAAPVEDPHSPEIRRLADDMIETLREAGGVGLAAPQIAMPLRLVIFYVPQHRVTNDPDDVTCEMTILANPEIAILDDEMRDGFEGCLSMPELRGVVPRAHRIRYSGIDPRSERGAPPVMRRVSGFHARVVQHECDHLDGRLYPTRMRDLSTLVYLEEQMAAVLKPQTVTA